MSKGYHTLEAISSAGAVATYSVTANDPEDGVIPATCTPPSGSTFPIGTTPVNCEATDSDGNKTTGSFGVTVKDTTPPTVSVPGPITAEAAGASGASVSYSASASDIVNGSLTPTCSPASGSTFAIGTTSVSCSATDAHSNKGTNSFTVKPPVFLCRRLFLDALPRYTTCVLP